MNATSETVEPSNGRPEKGIWIISQEISAWHRLLFHLWTWNRAYQKFTNGSGFAGGGRGVKRGKFYKITGHLRNYTFHGAGYGWQVTGYSCDRSSAGRRSFFDNCETPRHFRSIFEILWLIASQFPSVSRLAARIRWILISLFLIIFVFPCVWFDHTCIKHSIISNRLHVAVHITLATSWKFQSSNFWNFNDKILPLPSIFRLFIYLSKSLFELISFDILVDISTSRLYLY